MCHLTAGTDAAPPCPKADCTSCDCGCGCGGITITQSNVTVINISAGGTAADALATLKVRLTPLCCRSLGLAATWCLVHKDGQLALLSPVSITHCTSPYLQGVLPSGDDDVIILRGSGAHAMLRGGRAERPRSRLRLPASSGGLVAGAVGVHDAVVTAEAAATALEAAAEAATNP